MTSQKSASCNNNKHLSSALAEVKFSFYSLLSNDIHMLATNIANTTKRISRNLSILTIVNIIKKVIKKTFAQLHVILKIVPIY